MPRKNHTPKNTGARSVGQYRTRAKRHGEPKPAPRWGQVVYEPLTDEQYERIFDGLYENGLLK